MQYVDEGRLDVHVPLVRYLPELAGRCRRRHRLARADAHLRPAGHPRGDAAARAAGLSQHRRLRGRQPARLASRQPLRVQLSRLGAALRGHGAAQRDALRGGARTAPHSAVGHGRHELRRPPETLAHRPCAGFADGQPTGAGAAAALPGPGPASRRRALRQPAGPLAPGPRTAAGRWHLERPSCPEPGGHRRDGTQPGRGAHAPRSKTGASTRSGRAWGGASRSPIGPGRSGRSRTAASPAAASGWTRRPASPSPSSPTSGRRR